MPRSTPALHALGLAAVASLATGCLVIGANEEEPTMNDERRVAAEAAHRIAIEGLLNAWHEAASEADGERYFGSMTEDAVFLGTDATERWSVAEFRDYAGPHFAAGTGWTYTPVERHVILGPALETAWFDERLWNEKYGECRGTGALRTVDGHWKIAHYSLTFPIPNEMAAEFTQRIRELDG